MRCASGRRYNPLPFEDRIGLSELAGSEPVLSEPPALCERAWMNAQAAWVEEAVQRPIQVQGRNSKGDEAMPFLKTGLKLSVLSSTQGFRGPATFTSSALGMIALSTSGSSKKLRRL